MSLTIFQPLVDQQRTTQELQNIQRHDEIPEIGNVVSIGSDRQWQVFAVECYSDYDENRFIYLAHIHPYGDQLPVPTTGTIAAMQQFSSSLSFYVHVAPNGNVIKSGWSMAGGAPRGRLLGHGGTPVETEFGLLFENIDLPWEVDAVETYEPTGYASFETIHLCHCLPVEEKEPIAA